MKRKTGAFASSYLNADTVSVRNLPNYLCDLAAGERVAAGASVKSCRKCAANAKASVPLGGDWWKWKRPPVRQHRRPKRAKPNGKDKPMITRGNGKRKALWRVGYETEER